MLKSVLLFLLRRHAWGARLITYLMGCCTLCCQVTVLLRAGKHSGRNALRTKLLQMGYELTPENLDDVFKRFKVPHQMPLNPSGQTCCGAGMDRALAAGWI